MDPFPFSQNLLTDHIKTSDIPFDFETKFTQIAYIFTELHKFQNW